MFDSAVNKNQIPINTEVNLSGANLVTIDKPIVNFYQWKRQKITCKGKTLIRTRLVNVQEEKDVFVQTFLKELPDFREHCFRVGVQYQEMRVIKDEMQPQVEGVISMDYSENYSAKYMNSISAAYYDAQQVTIHPMVFYMKDAFNMQHITSYVGVSEVTNHGVATTFAFLQTLIPLIKCDNPFLSVLHFVTDSPASQYRNKSICVLVARFEEFFGIKCTWSWLESGHGKSVCDGIGGSIKKKADNMIKSNRIISNAEEFFSELNGSTEKMILVKVNTSDVIKAEREVKRWKPPMVTGISQMHFIAPVKNLLYMKQTTCLKLCCHPRFNVFVPVCQGWVSTGIHIGSNEIEDEEEEWTDVQTPELSQVEERDDMEEDRYEEQSKSEEEDVEEDRYEEQSKGYEEESNSEEHDQNEEEEQETTLQTGSFVAVPYEKRWFAGEIMKVLRPNYYEISFLTHSGERWRWGKKDVDNIKQRDILTVFSPPKQSGSFFKFSKEEISSTNTKYKNI